jgi:hypothetical protein
MTFWDDDDKHDCALVGKFISEFAKIESLIAELVHEMERRHCISQFVKRYPRDASSLFDAVDACLQAGILSEHHDRLSYIISELRDLSNHRNILAHGYLDFKRHELNGDVWLRFSRWRPMAGNRAEMSQWMCKCRFLEDAMIDLRRLKMEIADIRNVETLS